MLKVVHNGLSFFLNQGIAGRRLIGLGNEDQFRFSL